MENRNLFYGMCKYVLKGGTLSGSRRGSGRSVPLRPSRAFQAELAGGKLWEAVWESVNQGQAVCMAAKVRPLAGLMHAPLQRGTLGVLPVPWPRAASLPMPKIRA